MKTVYALRILSRLVKSRNGLSLQTIAAEGRVSYRSAKRYIEDLRSAGFEVVVEQKGKAYPAAYKIEGILS